MLIFINKEGLVADHVWGDIYRNKFLNSIQNEPKELTPGKENAEIHSSINAEMLRESHLWDCFKPPNERGNRGGGHDGEGSNGTDKYWSVRKQASDNS